MEYFFPSICEWMSVSLLSGSFLHERPLILAVQIRTYCVHIDCLLVFQVSLVVDVQRRNSHFGRGEVGYGVGRFPFVQRANSVRHGMGSIVVFVSDGDIEKLLIIVLATIVQVEVEVVVLYPGRFTNFLVFLIHLRKAETLIGFACPLQVPSSPIGGSADFRLIKVILSGEVMFSISHTGHFIG